MANKRNYRREYDRDQASPEQIHNRSLRNQARRKVEGQTGKLPTVMEVDHKRSLTDGGTNSSENLRVVSRTTNRKKGRS